MSPGRLLLGDSPDGLGDSLSLDNDQSVDEPIAVCGISLKFPQDAVSAETFWTMLSEKRSAMTEFPQDRFNIDAFYDPNRRNVLCTRGGHFLREDVGLFDAGFFSISPSEASAMDPQQRLLLEATFEAVENAGLRLEDLRGSRTSVHTGCFSNDYLQQLLRDVDRLSAYAAVGASQSMLANRISWFFDFRGPSMNIDSACSSGAMAIDYTCRLLRSGQTDMGVAAGCNLLLDLDYTTILSNMQMLSPDGKCFAFDHRANGYSRGEGVGVIVLKRLSDALKSNDTIRALIRASRSNQDGHTATITQPNGTAQAQLIRETYLYAGLSMKHTRFFEAHGTGTAVGDPTEIGAVAECFQAYRTCSDPLYVGSVKSNIGHLEGASGIAGVIKTILAIEAGVVPPNTNFERINPRLAAYKSCVEFPLSCLAWPSTRIRRASVNSFGYGGTNCHIVIDDVVSYLEEAGLRGNHRTAVGFGSTDLEGTYSNIVHHRADSSDLGDSGPVFHTPKLLVWSATSENTVTQSVSAWDTYCSKKLYDNDPLWIADVAYTLDSRRSLFPWRTHAIVSTHSDLAHLSKLSSRPEYVGTKAPRIAFVFTGQGAQWYAMGRELLAYRVFSNVVHDAETILSSFGLEWSVKGELLKQESESNIHSVFVSQVLTSVIEMGLVDLLAFFGVSPMAVVGHSMGEIAAAYSAGILTRESALRLVYYRGLYVSQIHQNDPVKGAMLAVALSVAGIKPYLEKLRAMSKNCNLLISCVNSPVSITISGEECHVEKLSKMLKADGIFARRLNVAVAYHSPQMEQISEDCLKAFAGLKAADPQCETQFISSVTGSLLAKEECLEARYWVSNLTSPVLFSQAIGRLCRDPPSALHKKLDGSHRNAIVVDFLVEIGPHAALRLPIQETLSSIPGKQKITYRSALYREKPATVTVLELMGELHSRGSSINLRHINDPDLAFSKHRISLVDSPSYPFDHTTRYWSESPLNRNYRLRPYGSVELLGNRSKDWNPLEPQWRCCVRTSEMPWLLHHRLSNKAIYPASAMLVMAIEGVAQLFRQQKALSGFTLRKVHFDAAIAVETDNTDLETRLCLKQPEYIPKDLCYWNFSVFSVSGDKWTRNCNGTIQAHFRDEESFFKSEKECRHYRLRWETTSKVCHQKVEPSGVYEMFKEYGFQYGTAFQGITAIKYIESGTAMTQLDLSKPLEVLPAYKDYIVHPASLDSLMQLALLGYSKGGSREIPTQAITAIEKLEIAAAGLQPNANQVAALATFEHETRRNKFYSAFAISEDKKKVCIALKGLKTTVIASQTKKPTTVERQSWYEIQSHADVTTIPTKTISKWLESACGPDVRGPKDFFRSLQSYLSLQMRRIKHDVRRDTLALSMPHLSNYLEWVDWQLSKTLNLDSALDEQALRKQVADQGLLGNFFLTIADNVMNVLQAKQDIVQLLFETNLVEQFYEQQSFGSIYYQKLISYLRALSHKHPDLNILEVGAGTGSFTQHVLVALSSDGIDNNHRFNNYCFTDISGAFFQKARERFATYAHRMAFKVFDVESDPINQDLQEGTYDIVSASNVLHVTKDLGKTLQRLRRLLKKGRKLILHEIVRPESIAMGFVFGLLPGWWPSFEDERTMSPIISEVTWDDLMRRNGFSGADFTLHDYADHDAHLMSIMCTTAVESQEMIDNHQKMTIAIDGDSCLQKRSAEILKERFNPRNNLEVQIVHLDHCQSFYTSDLLVTLFDMEAAILSRLSQRTFEALKTLLASASNILWTHGGSKNSADPAFGMLNGFAQVFRIENPKSSLATFALESTSKALADRFQLLVSAIHQGLQPGGFNQFEDYRVVDGVLHFNRICQSASLRDSIKEKLCKQKLTPCLLSAARPFKISVQQADLLPSLRIDASEGHSNCLKDDEVEVEVRAMGLNQVDAFTILNDTSAAGFGQAVAGTIVAAGIKAPFLPGDRVCAYNTNGLSSSILVHHKFVARIHETMSFQMASTLSREYVFAEYLLQQLGNLRGDSTVLIHSGCSRVACALLDILQPICGNIVATLSTENYLVKQSGAFNYVKKPLLRTFFEEFHDICPNGADTVMDLGGSENLDLGDYVCDLGRIFNVRDVEAQLQQDLGARYLARNATTISLSMEKVLRVKGQSLHMPSQIIRNGQVPEFDSCDMGFSLHSFKLSAYNDALSSLKDLSSGENVVLEFDEEDELSITTASKPAYSFRKDASYVIAGGLGDLGRCLVRWMVERGGKNFILLSRSGLHTDVAKDMVRKLDEKGVNVFAPLCDIADARSLGKALEQATKTMPPIKGCIQASAALRDVMYENMDFKAWSVAIDPKVQGSWNLHQALPEGMDFFILASSISGVIGQATQINYAAGNAYQDALARYRVSIGEKATSLDLGILQTGGLLSQSNELRQRLMSKNLYTPILEPELLALFDHFCDPALPLDQLNAQVVTGIARPSLHAQPAEDLPLAFRQPLWSLSLSRDRTSSKTEQPDTFTAANAVSALEQAPSAAEAASIATEALAEQFCRMLLLPRAKLSLEQPLHAAGADSLCAVDLRNWILKTFDVDVPVFDILGDTPAKALGATIAAEWQALRKRGTERGVEGIQRSP